ncbi:MAG: FAD-dependent oxidoreductase, partial [Anaerotignum sp.]|nr:FAD-dependent oxidoreductase [Anaerotignum sp.]
TDLIFEDGFQGVKLKNVKTEEEKELSCDGVFISVGRKPVTDFLAGQVELDAAGYIIADESGRTNIPGVFAVGDVRTKALRQIVTAVADGANASHYIDEYLAEQA